MQFSTVFYALSVVAVALAKNTVNLEIVLGMEPNLAANTRVWFYELYTARGDPTDCVSGYKHVRLISGARTGTSSRPGNDFKGKYSDVGADLKNGKFEGGKTWADQNDWSGSHSRTYQWIGTTSKSDAQIKTDLQNYVHNHPTYKMLDPNAVNCKTGVESCTNTPVQSAPSKREIEDVFDDAEAKRAVEAALGSEEVPVRAEVFVA